MFEVESFIADQLDQAGIAYRVSRGFIHVACPFHQHSGRKLKLGFSAKTGGAHCWVCSETGQGPRHWNQYAELKGLATFDHDDPTLQDFRALKAQFDSLVTETTPGQPTWLERWRGRWRGLPGRFLRQVPSYLWYDEASEARRILWPCYMDDEYQGCVAARLDNTTWPKVRSFAGLVTNRLLFPFDLPMVRSSRVVCLVEGQFDALRFCHLGLPAVSIWGTGNWSRHKATRLAARGVERVVICMDGDRPGEAAAQLIQQDCAPLFDTKTYLMPDPTRDEFDQGIDSIDPGNCNNQVVEEIRRLCEGDA